MFVWFGFGLGFGKCQLWVRSCQQGKWGLVLRYKLVFVSSHNSRPKCQYCGLKCYLAPKSDSGLLDLKFHSNSASDSSHLATCFLFKTA